MNALMRSGHSHICGCFPTGRHYPGIADRIAKAVVKVRGLANEFEPGAPWASIPVAVIDFETTGLSADEDRILEVGVVTFDGGEVSERHNWLINPTIPVPEEARKVHGISDDDIATAPRFEEALAEIVGAISGRLPVAYNASFDRKFLLAEFARTAGVLDVELPPALRHEVIWVDPLVWVRELHKYEDGGNKLTTVCERMGIDIGQAHRATDDSAATGQVLYRLAADMPRTYGELIRIQTQYEAQQEAEMVTWRSRRS